MTANNKTTRLISAVLIISILLPSVFLSLPKKAEAIPVIDAPLTALVTGLGKAITPPTWMTKALTAIGVPKTVASWLIESKNFAASLLREILKLAAKRILARMTQATINWINSDFHGAPLFVQNPGSFFKDIAKSEIRNLVDMIGYDTFRFPFGPQTALNVISSYKRQLADNAEYTLSKVINDPDLLRRYRNDFNYGGWNGFLVNTQYPQNNYLGFQGIIQQNLASRLQGTLQAPAEKIQGLLQQGMGFLSPQKCPSNPSYNNGTNEFLKPSFKPTVKYNFQSNIPPVDRYDGGGEDESDAYKAYDKQVKQEQKVYTKQFEENEAKDKAKWAETNTCPGGLQSTTPGSVAANQVMSALNVPFLTTALDGALGNSLAAIFDALLNHFLDKGLNALGETISSSPSNDNWSYNGDSLSGTSTYTTPGVSALRIPQNVTATVGQTTRTMISGGTAPYIIGTLPNATIATTQISTTGSSGPTISVTGVAPGQTLLVVRDSSIPAQMVTVQVAINAIGALVVIPRDISTDLNNPISARISGGAEPYNMRIRPNQAIAIVEFAGSNIIVSGVGRGNTFIVIEDSSTPMKTTTVQITITGAEDLTIPQNISANVGQVTTVPISGGTAPYTITDQQDVRVATAQILNAVQNLVPGQQVDNSQIPTTIQTPSTLKITGIAAGETSIAIQDSSVPMKITTTTIIVIDNRNLIITPPNVSANIDQITSMTISGGVAPYGIDTPPNTTVATAQISGPNITIVGKTAGQTSMIVKDSSMPIPKTVTVDITIGALNVPSNVAVGINQSTSITISGGIAPYSIDTPPNTTVATAQIPTQIFNSNTITITGKARGQTGIVVSDSSTPAKTTGVQITVN